MANLEELRNENKRLKRENERLAEQVQQHAEHAQRLADLFAVSESRQQSLITSINNIQIIEKNAYNAGVVDGELRMYNLFTKLEHKKASWLSTYQLLSGLSVSTHGERTRQSVDNTLEALIVNTHELDKTTRQLAVKYDLKLDVDEVLTLFTNVTHDIRAVVMRYLEQPSKRTLEHVAVWFSKQTEGHAFLVADALNIQTATGRTRDEVKAFVGDYALQHEHKTNWHVIRDIVRDIRNTTADNVTPLQQLTLERFIEKGWVDADTGRLTLQSNAKARRNAGKYVQQAKINEN